MWLAKVGRLVAASELIDSKEVLGLDAQAETPVCRTRVTNLSAACRKSGSNWAPFVFWPHLERFADLRQPQQLTGLETFFGALGIEFKEHLRFGIAFAFCMAIHPTLDEWQGCKIHVYKFSQPFDGIRRLVGIVPAAWLLRGTKQSSQRFSVLLPPRFFRNAGASARERGLRQRSIEFMKAAWRKSILRANGAYLMLASTVGILTMDIPGIYFNRGPQSRLLTAPYAGIGFLEAHGLAFIIGVLLWRAAPAHSWHVTALAVQALLGTSNLLFWQIFPATDSMAAGYVFTSLHWIFVSLQLAAALTRERASSVHLPTQFRRGPNIICK